MKHWSVDEQGASGPWTASAHSGARVAAPWGQHAVAKQVSAGMVEAQIRVRMEGQLLCQICRLPMRVAPLDIPLRHVVRR
jgi:hypothetical protein